MRFVLSKVISIFILKQTNKMEDVQARKDKLRELKNLYDDKLISEEVYNQRQLEILAEERNNSRFNAFAKSDAKVTSTTAPTAPTAPTFAPTPTPTPIASMFVDTSVSTPTKKLLWEAGPLKLYWPQWGGFFWGVWLVAAVVWTAAICAVVSVFIKSIIPVLSSIPIISVGQFAVGVIAIGQFAVGFITIGTILSPNTFVL